ncbi:cupredoxin domain-containing protein [Streptomyces sp. NPDC001068]|uniref:cupredoxin domain-containing protein n=1 Tax=Streptomyces sp. NPDC001068 TaxID=3364544 RepID=UPI003674ABF1
MTRTALAVLVLSAACMAPTNAYSASASRAGTARIVIEDFGFSPDPLKVTAGAVVTVVNKDTDPHTVTASGSASFDTGRIAPGGTTRFTAPRTHGGHPYRCDFHQFMSGTLTVR